MLSTRLRTTRNKSERRQKWTWPSGIGFVKDVLDVVIKISVILLPLPALAVFLYLKTLHRTDLFLPAILSGPGLVALLETTFVLCTSILLSLVGPSWFAVLMTHTYGKDSRPTSGAASYILVVGLLAGPFYLLVFYLLGASWPAWLKWIAGSFAFLLLAALLFALAWSSPSHVRTLTASQRANRKERLSKSLFRTLIGLVSGGYTILAVATIYTFARPYQLAEEGWQAFLIGCAIIFVSLLPGAAYLLQRSRGEPPAMSALRASVAVVAPILCLMLSGASLQPLALIAMRAMGIAEKDQRTFELVKESERPVWAALGFKFVGRSPFFTASIRFQFGNVTLLCASPYDPAGPYPGALDPLGDKHTQDPIPSSGCATILKDEVRVVDPPGSGFLGLSDHEPAVRKH